MALEDSKNVVDLGELAELKRPLRTRVFGLPLENGVLVADRRLIGPQGPPITADGRMMIWMLPEEVVEAQEKVSPIIWPHYEI